MYKLDFRAQIYPNSDLYKHLGIMCVSKSFCLFFHFITNH